MGSYSTSYSRRGAQISRRQLPPARSGAGSRPLFIGLSLVGVLTLTGVLLRAMQGAPLTADAAYNLVSADSRASLQVIFQTRVGANPNRWKSIYIHHSRTPSGDARTLANAQGACGDHFVITNGNGSVDGEVQFTSRWDEQKPADPAPGVARVDAACITICVVGDFDQSTPTATQLKRLEQLVQTLQERFRIPAQQVWMFDVPGSAGGVGKYFPVSAFNGQLLR